MRAATNSLNFGIAAPYVAEGLLDGDEDGDDETEDDGDEDGDAETDDDGDGEDDGVADTDVDGLDDLL